MDIKPTITYYPLKMLDGLFHIFKRTEQPALTITEEDACEPCDDWFEANAIVELLNDKDRKEM
jgi:hypothetical protein